MQQVEGPQVPLTPAVKAHDYDTTGGRRRNTCSSLCCVVITAEINNLILNFDYSFGDCKTQTDIMVHQVICIKNIKGHVFFKQGKLDEAEFVKMHLLR